MKNMSTSVDIHSLAGMMLALYCKQTAVENDRLVKENKELILENERLKKQGNFFEKYADNARRFVSKIYPYYMRIIRSFRHAYTNSTEPSCLSTGSKGKGMIYIALVPAVVDTKLCLLIKGGRTNSIDRRIKEYPMGTEIMHSLYTKNMMNSEVELLDFMNNLAHENNWRKHRAEYWNAGYTTKKQWEQHINIIVTFMHEMK